MEHLFEEEQYSEDDLKKQKENERNFVDEMDRLKKYIPEIKQFISNTKEATKDEKFLKSLRDYALFIWRVVHVPFDEKEVYGKGGGAYGYFARHNLTMQQKEKYKKLVMDIALQLFNNDETLVKQMINHVDKKEQIMLIAGGYSPEESKKIYADLSEPGLRASREVAASLINKMRKSKSGVINISDRD